MTATNLPTIAEIEAAVAVVRRHLAVTPLLRHPGLCALVGTEVRVKHEEHHGVGAFKVRGGVVLAERLDDAARRAGLVTASTGNHGQSIAYAGRVAGVPVTVAVPERANSAKVAAMRALGAEVVEAGKDFDDARAWAAERAAGTGARFVGATEPELLAGVGTATLEILEQDPTVEVIIVAVGGGSGAASACLVTAARAPHVEVIAVQAEAAPAAYRSWREGRLVEADCSTAAEGVATRVPFANTQAVLRDRLADFVLVSEEELRAAAVAYVAHAHSLAELAGAASLAAAVKLRDRLAGRRVAVVLSGGNVTVDQLRALLAPAGRI